MALGAFLLKRYKEAAGLAMLPLAGVVLYYLARKGGDALVRKRFSGRSLERAVLFEWGDWFDCFE